MHQVVKNQISLNKDNRERYTPRYAIEPLAEELLTISKGDWIWNMADDEKSLYPKVFNEYGFTVLYTDISRGVDFIDRKEYPSSNIRFLITNPPFKGKYKWLEKCLQLDKEFMLLLPVPIFNDSTWIKLFEKYGKNPTIRFFTDRIEFSTADGTKLGRPSFGCCYLGWIPQIQDIGAYKIKTS